MTRKKLFISITTILAVMMGSLYSGGFQINEHGARAMSMGGAFTGLADDASAVYYNSAAMTNLEGVQFLAGTTIILPEASFRGIAPDVTEYELEPQVFTPINFYYSQKFNDKFAAGLSVNNPYGLGTKWEEDWAGRFLAVETAIETFFITPSIAYEVIDGLSIGAGISYVYANVLISKKIPLFTGNEEATITMEGDAPSAFGYSASLFYAPTDKFSLGLSYKSEVDVAYEGDAVTEGPDMYNGLLPSGGIKADLTLPMNFTAGLAFKAMENLTFTADYQFIGWSSYDKLEVEFDDNADWNTSAERNYDDAFIIRGGVEYWVNESFALRTGIIYDKHPVKDEMSEPSLPDSDRLGFNYGLGYSFNKNFTVDVAYMYLRFAEKTIDNSVEGFNGTYNSVAHLMALNFSYKF